MEKPDELLSLGTREQTAHVDGEGYDIRQLFGRRPRLIAPEVVAWHTLSFYLGGQPHTEVGPQVTLGGRLGFRLIRPIRGRERPILSGDFRDGLLYPQSVPPRHGQTMYRARFGYLLPEFLAMGRASE